MDSPQVIVMVSTQEGHASGCYETVEEAQQELEKLFAHLTKKKPIFEYKS